MNLKVHFDWQILTSFLRTALLGGVVVAFFIFAPEIQAPLRMLASAPYVVLVNIMACRVYRRTRMGVIRESEISTSAIDRAILPAPHAIMFNNNNSTTSEAPVPHIISRHDGTGTRVGTRSLALDAHAFLGSIP